MAVLFLKKIMVVVGEFYRVFMVVYSLLLKCNPLGSCDMTMTLSHPPLKVIMTFEWSCGVFLC